MNRKLKLVLAGGCVACTLGVIALRVAWATPGQGVTRTLIAGPVQLGEIDIKTQTDTHKAKIDTKGQTDAYVQINRVAPGGYSGWHSHPGPVSVLVKTGIATRYDAADPTRTPTTGCRSRAAPQA